ncbi:MAG TPA: S26 family signal peptidase [Phycisphaerae bacterium]|nr:S26 family signal peptidase [Phycisphaerae bacterium]
MGLTPLRPSVLLAGFLLGGLALVTITGWRLNLSPSMPVGIWRVVTPSPAGYQRGEAVTVCPPVAVPFLSQSCCPAGRQRLLKQLVALPGDVVTVTPAGVRVNGGPLLPHSAPLALTRAGQPLPQHLGTWRLTGYWLYGTGSPRSFDSRYFGEVPAACLQGLARPVWVSES